MYGTSMLDLSLEDLMALPVVSAAVSKEQPLREAAGIMSVIHADEIRALGARDLMEVLAMIPSFDFAADVEGVVGLLFRGQFVHNGKYLLLVDGQVMTELAFGTVPMGNNIPAQSIERIEIIRGPGSTIYGGFAELAVINVISKKPSDTEKGELVLTQASSDRVRTRSAALLHTGTVQGDLRISATGSYDVGIRSDREFRDFSGNAYMLNHDGGLSNTFANLSVGYKGFSLRYLKNNYILDMRDFYAENAPRAVKELFITRRAEANYDGTIGANIHLNAAYNYLFDKPWYIGGDDMRQLELENPESLGGAFYNSTVNRHQATVTLDRDVTSAINLLAGASYYHERGGGTTLEGDPQPNYYAHNFAIFSQALLSSNYGTFSAGTRYERNSNYDSQLVSRGGVTKTFGRWHTKFLYSESFHPPQYQVILDFYDPSGIQDRIRPETTRTWEIEVGRLITPQLSATMNLYTLTTKDAITYYYDPEHHDSYGNFGNLASRGIEAEIKYSASRDTLSLCYAFYRADNSVALYQVTDPDGTVRHRGHALAAAPHKLVLRGSAFLTDGIRWTAMLNLKGNSYGYSRLADDGESALASRVPPVFGLNSSVLFEKVQLPYHRAIDIQVGVNNILDQNVRYYQAYNSGHAPIPGMSREYILSFIGRF
jgi:outer membrane cobalamin receptor